LSAVRDTCRHPVVTVYFWGRVVCMECGTVIQE